MWREGNTLSATFFKTAIALYMINVQHKISVLPRIAILDDNTLACIGLMNLLQSIMPQVEIDCFGSFAELSANHPGQYFHYFVSLHQLLVNKDFFSSNCKKTIVMMPSVNSEQLLSGFHCLNINVSQHSLVKELLSLEQGAHAQGKGLPAGVRCNDAVKVLSGREIEVLVLIVKGLLNKEIAERLSISLSTVITHRRNIMDKLRRRSIGALTIYAVMHGYLNVDDI